MGDLDLEISAEASQVTTQIGFWRRSVCWEPFRSVCWEPFTWLILISHKYTLYGNWKRNEMSNANQLSSTKDSCVKMGNAQSKWLRIPIRTYRLMSGWSLASLVLLKVVHLFPEVCQEHELWKVFACPKIFDVSKLASPLLRIKQGSTDAALMLPALSHLGL